MIDGTAIVWSVIEDDETDEVSAYLRMDVVVEVDGEKVVMEENPDLINICWTEPKQGRRVQDIVQVKPSFKTGGNLSVMISNGASPLN